MCGKDPAVGGGVGDSENPSIPSYSLVFMAVAPQAPAASSHHAEYGIDDDVDGHGGRCPPVPYGAHALLVAGQEVSGQALQSWLRGVAGPKCPLPPGWEGRVLSLPNLRYPYNSLQAEVQP